MKKGNIILYGFSVLSAVISILYLAPSCDRGKVFTAMEGDTLYIPSYATGFMVTQAAEGKILNIFDPWQGAGGVTSQVFLAGAGNKAPEGFEGVSLRVPLSSVVCMSSTYVAYIDELGRTDAIKGVSGAKYISNPRIREAYSAGAVSEVGYDAGINYELLSVLSPDVVLAYGITGENSVMSSKLANLGINLVYIGDYVEQSPLGKAEWLVAFGYLFGDEERAIEIFRSIEESYCSIKETIETSIMGDKPVVMLNSPYRDTWFVPGDRSYMVTLVNDAGGIYACAGEDSDLSRPVSLEDAYIKMLSSDLWLNPGTATTLEQVKAENPRFTETPPVVNGMVFNNNKRQTPEGGSDFWESGAVRPDVVLRDMVSILHPGLVDHGDLIYFRRLD